MPDRCWSLTQSPETLHNRPLRDGQTPRGRGSPAVKPSADCCFQEAGWAYLDVHACSWSGLRLVVGALHCSLHWCRGALPQSQGSGFRGPAFSIGLLLLLGLPVAHSRPPVSWGLTSGTARFERSGGCAWMVSWHP